MAAVSPDAMQLLTLNSLLMFDVVFIFFLFLVGVSCIVYYLPPQRRLDIDVILAPGRLDLTLPVDDV